jgi:23S rRNA pseudouridine2605 synthase
MWLVLTLHEGKNRMIRRGLEALGHPVLRLVRESIGHVTLEGLKEGQWRNLTDREIHQLLPPSANPKR